METSSRVKPTKACAANILITSLTCSAIKGYDFGDNKMNKFVGPDNGILRAEMAGYFPPTLTICFRFYIKYNRFNRKIGMINIYSPYDDITMPFYNIHCMTTGWCGTELYGTYLKSYYYPDPHYPNRNYVRKWSSFCVGLDFLEDLSTAAFNGKEVNKTAIQEARKGQKLNNPKNQ